MPQLLYTYQLILVCQIRDNPAIVSVQFLKGTEDRVFCMASTQFLASSVTRKDRGTHALMAYRHVERLRRLSASSSVSSMVIMTADPPRLADDGVLLLPGDGACVRAAAKCNEYAAQRPT